MKLHTTIKYQISETIKPILVFYAILMTALFLPTLWRGSIEFSGTELATVIFIFVIGLNSFRTNFLFAQANGVSRKTQFKAFVLSILAVSMFMSLVDIVYMNTFASVLPSISLFSMIYETDYILSLPVIALLAINLIWNFTLYAMFAMLGYCVNLIYYRSGLLMKLVVSILPAIFVFVFIPYLAFANPIFFQAIREFGAFTFGLTNNPNPVNSMLTFGLLFLIFSLGSFLLIRRAPIK